MMAAAGAGVFDFSGVDFVTIAALSLAAAKTR
jgi:hypothetical protein